MADDPNGKLNFGLSGVSTSGIPVSFDTSKTALSFGSPLPAQNDKSNETSISTNVETGEIIIQNSSGATIVVSPNGDININATKALKFSTGSDIAFEAGGNISFNGKNFSLQTAGAASFNIDGDMTTGVTGNKNDVVGNASSETVNGTKASTVRGTLTQIAGSGMTTLALGGMNNYVKGDMNTSIDGGGTIASSGTLKMTSEGSMYVSSPSINMGASNLSVFGASGFIGGSGVNIDGNRVTAEEMKATTINADGMKATTFEGDLKGIAEFSEASLIGGTFNSVGDVDDNPEITSEAMNDDYLASGPGGVVDVEVDPNNTIEDLIDLGAQTGGALNAPPTLEQIQAMLRDGANRDNPALTNWLVENGYLSPTYRNTTPRGVRGITGGPGAGTGGGGGGGGAGFTPEKNLDQDRYTPVPQYDPNQTTGPARADGPGIRSSLLVGEGVPLATFLKLGAKLETLTTREEKLQFARYAHIHVTYFYNKYKNDPAVGSNRLEVVMGLYTPPSRTGSVDPGGINDLAQTGRVAVYEVLDASGKQNLDATFALASRLANKEIFDKLILDYDTYETKDTPSSPENPNFTKNKGIELEDGSIANVKLIVVLPEFGSDYIFGRAKNETETLLNGESQGKYLMNLQLGTSALDHDIYTHGLVQELIDILAYVGNATGLRAVTTSGNRGAGGSGRHNGHASDTALYLNGRSLSVRNAADLPYIQQFTRLFIQTARARGFRPSVGVEGPFSRQLSGGYMSGTSFHYDIAAGRVISAGRAAIWGDDDGVKDARGQSGDTAPAWLRQMFNE
jgi:hypothetical protein